MTIEPLSVLHEVLQITPDVYGDERGHFMEVYNAAAFEAAGLPHTFVQDNLSRSIAGVVRGLHFQNPTPQGKLVRAVHGAILDVAVDIRVGSPTFGRWDAAVLSAENKVALWVPEGFAHGFGVLDGPADVLYKCTAPYAPDSEHTLLWNDPAVGVEWPNGERVVSEKDRAGRTIEELGASGALPEPTP